MPCLEKLLFWSYSWKSSQSIILEDYVIRYICGWNQLISWILCIWTDYQKRKTSNLIFLTRQLGMPSIPNTPRELRGYLRAVVSPHTFPHILVHRLSQPILFFFPIRVFFTDTEDSQDSRGREETIFYSTLPLPTTHKHWDIYLQCCMWDDYHTFLIATLVFTRRLLDEIYHLIELPF